MFPCLLLKARHWCVYVTCPQPAWAQEDVTHGSFSEAFSPDMVKVPWSSERNELPQIPYYSCRRPEGEDTKCCSGFTSLPITPRLLLSAEMSSSGMHLEDHHGMAGVRALQQLKTMHRFDV